VYLIALPTRFPRIDVSIGRSRHRRNCRRSAAEFPCPTRRSATSIQGAQHLGDGERGYAWRIRPRCKPRRKCEVTKPSCSWVIACGKLQRWRRT
jgi:hypothetical protein